MAAGMAHLSARMRRGEAISRRETLQMMAALSLPAILEQVVSTAMQYIDTAMVGQLGAGATAAIGVVSSTTWLFGGLMGGLATGFAVQIAQYLGAQRETDARDVFRQAIRINILAGALLGLLGLGISGFLPVWLGAEAAIRPDATAYFAVYALNVPFQLAQMLYSAILRCSGDARTPSIANALLCPLDVCFNALLIYPARTVSLGGLTLRLPGAGLGVLGAALGTAAATAIISILLFLCVALRPGPLALAMGGRWRFTPACLRNLRKVALPVAAERVALSSAQVFLTRIVAPLGTVAIAANSLAVNTEALCYLSGYGIQAAALALVGQAVGAARPDIASRFARWCTLAGSVLMGISGILMYLFAPWLMGLFTPDAAVIALGAQVLRVECFAEPLFGASIVASGAMQGAGDSRAPFLLSLLSMWGVRITLALVLVGPLGLMGVWVAMCLELCFRGIVFLVRLLRGKWLRVGALQ